MQARAASCGTEALSTHSPQDKLSSRSDSSVLAPVPRDVNSGQWPCVKTEDAAEHTIFTEKKLILAMQSSPGLQGRGGETDSLNVKMSNMSQTLLSQDWR